MTPSVAVCGHVEWVDFLVVERLPAAGEIMPALEHHDAPAGGGGMAIRALLALGADAVFLCAVGDDGWGKATVREMRALGARVEAAVRDAPQRRAVVFLTGDGERTITTIGERHVPRGDDGLAFEAFDGIYVTGGDAAALRAARASRVVVATPRAGPALTEVEVDVVVASSTDPDEAVPPGAKAGVVVLTAGAKGGTWRARDGSTGSWDSVPLPGPKVDTYGCGDSFAAALTYGLACGERLDDALGRAAAVGASVATTRAPAVAL